MNETYLIHHGILGQKWGIRRYQNEDGTLTSQGKQRYSDKERKNNGKELNEVIKKSKSHSDTGRASAKEVWENSSTMKKFLENTRRDYATRNDIYNYKKEVPKKYVEKYKGVFNDDEIRYYGYGEHFEKIMRKKASELVYDKKDVEKIIALVERADFNDYGNGTYHDKAWLYWH